MKIKLLGLEELNFVEIVCMEQGRSFELYSEKSKYLQGEIFSLFQHCFELSSSEYDYYLLSSFKVNQVVTLRNHLVTNQARIHTFTSAEDFEKFILKKVAGIDFINALKENFPDWKITWKKIRSDLLKVGEDLIEMTDVCIDEDLVLWIKGY